VIRYPFADEKSQYFNKKLSFKTLIRIEIDDENHFPDHLKCSQYFFYPLQIYSILKKNALFLQNKRVE